jgi:tripartite-type tricarboxylate transporter receptor subunit TctC
MSLKSRRWLAIPLSLAFSSFILLSAACALAAAFPTKTVTMIIPFAPGGGPDASFRMLSSEAEKDLGRKIVIVNRPGPGGAPGVAETIMSKPDGYTVGFCAVAIATIQPLLQDVPYKGPDDLMPLVQTGEAPTLVYVKADSPYKSLKDLIEDARKRPGQVSVGVTGAPYNLLHVQFVLLEKYAGVKFNFVPYGSADHLPAVLGGVVPAAIGQVAMLTQHIKAGSARALGVFGSQKAKLLPDVPLVKDLGYDITDIPYEFVMGPKGIPKEPADTLIAAFGKAVKSQVFQDYGERTGLVVSYAGPEELTKKLRVDAERHRKLVDELGWSKKK